MINFWLLDPKKIYNKRELNKEIPQNEVSRKKNGNEDMKKFEDEEVVVPKKKRETIKSLDSKIQNANNFLEQLSKKIEDREQEIRSLKKVISGDRTEKADVNAKNGCK